MTNLEGFLFLAEKTQPTRLPHCAECGRFVALASVVEVKDHETDNYEAMGRCGTHGPVDVVWERA